ncbi:MAG: hypothetical protein JJ959_02870 [Nisaea sp.]|uniref:glycine-rich protein n=1 Tax=Nisaea sp. TaxID=2024842 RepID=UPI001B0940FE|nr:glycine-rich protein [Nisaea sp.]MBO6559446.1 hypothetical protein [Nisaea sp.]
MLRAFLLFLFSTIILSLYISSGAFAADCSSPDGNEAEIDYFVAENVYKFCNGTEWVSMVDTGGGSGATCDTTKQVFSYTGTEQSFTIPEGCTKITIKAWGGAGGGSSYNGYLSPGGTGGYAKGTVSVTPGNTISIVVGGGGSSGYIGSSTYGDGSGGFGGGGDTVANPGSEQSGAGAGGGASYVFSGETPYIVAGGGGGASSLTGGGGANYAGGSGGGTTGEAGTGTYTPGVGGTQSVAGLNATCHSTSGGKFVIGGGGSASGYSTGANTGGAGGGGYCGGGAGTSTTNNSNNNGDAVPGGGGGSGYIIATATDTTLTAGPAGSTLQGTSSGIPPNNTDPDYVSGVGASAIADGGNGLVVIVPSGS